jgi:hypothetical protein
MGSMKKQESPFHEKGDSFRANDHPKNRSSRLLPADDCLL